MTHVGDTNERFEFGDYSQGLRRFRAWKHPFGVCRLRRGYHLHVPGHSPLSGDYTGHDQIGGFFQRTIELSGGAFSIDVHNVLAENDLVVALVTVNAERNGLSELFPEIHVWRMKNGKATDFREYQGDEQREDRFWS